MTFFDTVRPVARNSGFFVNLINAFQDWNDARATRRALENLSDRELEDIGLSRSDIAHMR